MEQTNFFFLSFLQCIRGFWGILRGDTPSLFMLGWSCTSIHFLQNWTLHLIFLATLFELLSKIWWCWPVLCSDTAQCSSWYSQIWWWYTIILVLMENQYDHCTPSHTYSGWYMCLVFWQLHQPSWTKENQRLFLGVFLVINRHRPKQATCLSWWISQPWMM